MKHLKSNGRTLEVREAMPIIYSVTATQGPLPLMDEVMEDAAAREEISNILKLPGTKGSSNVGLILFRKR